VGSGSAALAVVVGLGALYVAVTAPVAYCSGWQETFLLAGFLTILSGAFEFANQTRAAEIVVGVDVVLFCAYAGGYWFGPFTCASHLL
jgi:hypothetical protein